MPKISIITCTKNSADFLTRNFNSVDKQNFRNIEHIFIDAQSNDGTKSAIRSYQNSVDYPVRLYEYPPKGVSDAFNKGIEKAKGGYLYFLNSDDFLHDKDVLKDAHRYLKKTGADWIYGKIRVLDEDENEEGIFPKHKIFQISNRQILKYINYVPHQAVFIRSKVFKEYGKFLPELKLNMDTEYWIRVSDKTEWIYFDRVIANYMLRAGSLSSDKNNKSLGINNLEKAQKMHLNKLEFFIAKIVNGVIQKINKTYS